jgi:hypothetical protein
LEPDPILEAQDEYFASVDENDGEYLPPIKEAFSEDLPKASFTKSPAPKLSPTHPQLTDNPALNPVQSAADPSLAGAPTVVPLTAAKETPVTAPPPTVTPETALADNMAEKPQLEETKGKEAENQEPPPQYIMKSLF